MSHLTVTMPRQASTASPDVVAAGKVNIAAASQREGLAGAERPSARIIPEPVPAARSKARAATQISQERTAATQAAVAEREAEQAQVAELALASAQHATLEARVAKLEKEVVHGLAVPDSAGVTATAAQPAASTTRSASATRLHEEAAARDKREDAAVSEEEDAVEAKREAEVAATWRQFLAVRAREVLAEPSEGLPPPAAPLRRRLPPPAAPLRRRLPPPAAPLRRRPLEPLSAPHARCPLQTVFSPPCPRERTQRPAIQQCIDILRGIVRTNVRTKIVSRSRARANRLPSLTCPALSFLPLLSAQAAVPAARGLPAAAQALQVASPPKLATVSKARKAPAAAAVHPTKSAKAVAVEAAAARAAAAKSRGEKLRAEIRRDEKARRPIRRPCTVARRVCLCAAVCRCNNGVLTHMHGLASTAC